MSTPQEEDVEFPILCETCLGPNPYIRMSKLPNDRACKICERPFTVYRWQPGPGARYKKTELCRTCAKVKNVCQTCVFDLQYNLPVQVRDSILAQQDRINLPANAKERTNMIAKLEQNIEDGDTQVLSVYQKSNPILESMARRNPYYERNRAKPCTFFARGACTRGDMCPYRHEIPEKNELSRQNIQDRYFGMNDPVANKILKKATTREQRSLPPPEDTTITTLWVGGIPENTSEKDIRDVFLPHGELLSVHVVPEKACAFVTFLRRGAAEEAASKLCNKLYIHEKPCRLAWGKKGNDSKNADSVVRNASTSAMAVPPPPGLNPLSAPTQYASMKSDYVAPAPSRPPGL